MNCATGFAIGFPAGRHPSVGQVLPLTQVFRMTTSRINGKIRCKAFTETVPSELTVTVATRTVDFQGQTHELLDYPLNDLACPRCKEKKLRFYLADPDTCPSCGAVALHKHVTLGPLLLPPLDDSGVS